MRIRLNLAYDGTEYKGWQLQPEVPTIQNSLEYALSKMFNVTRIAITGSGRTDAGVHAVGQVAHADLPVEREENEIKRGLNALLPDDIQVHGVMKVPDSFHARFSATKRVYVYRILEKHDIFNRRFAWHPPFQFDIASAGKLAENFLGSHDFRQFSTRPDNIESTTCFIKEIQFFQTESGWLFTISADRFLRKMVRTIVGTLLEASSGLIGETQLRDSIDGATGRVGTPAPPQGLALFRVHYDIDEPDHIPEYSIWRESP
ncbi:MAG: tRNA pseudouridine(38-40) synthase TruA [Candidatus Electryonea clarkiae]|nr:tRNA pseudouridine(38-40) synthase TruA [Candidatus Electryonea clarkiae]MDP8286341.1 tRNA pseudouridine(38-40) synthase TruA [Candidatus Electryonea clarkiae]